MADWVDAIEAVITVCPTTSEWLVNFFSSGMIGIFKKHVSRYSFYRWIEVSETLPA